MKITKFFPFVVLLVFQACTGVDKKLTKVLTDEFGVPCEVVVSGNDLVVQISDIPSEDLFVNYQLSTMVGCIVHSLGESDFKEFDLVRFDVSALHTSYSFPTKVVLAVPERLGVIGKLIQKLNSEDFIGAKSFFDDKVTDELYEEQIIKEWNSLLQQNHMKPIGLVSKGYKMFKLPNEKDYMVQYGFYTTNKNAFVEVLFPEVGDKIVLLNITLL